MSAFPSDSSLTTPNTSGQVKTWLLALKAACTGLLGTSGTAADARTALGAAASGVNADITSLVGLTTALPISQGGTGGVTQAAALSALGAAINGVLAKAGAYTVVAGDRGRLIDCTGTWTLALTAAATLGDGFVIGVRNSGTGVITIDPNSSETVDGAATIALAAGESCFCVCTGSAWVTVGAAHTGIGYGQSWQNVTGSRATGTTYYNTTGVPIEVVVSGSNGVGYTLTVVVGGVALSTHGWDNNSYVNCNFIVPRGASYSVVASGTGTINNWMELR